MRLILVFFCFQSCAIADRGYVYKISKDEESQLSKTNSVIRQVNSATAKGELLIFRDLKNPHKINFVEIGRWIEEFKLTNGEFALDEIEYDNFGNIKSRVAKTRKNNNVSYHILEIWTSEFKIANSDSLFVQHAKSYLESGSLWEERSMLVVNYKEKLNDRFKTKRKYGVLKRYGKDGKITKEKYYK